MLKEKAGVIAGQIWEALNETEGKTQKQLKKEAKLKADKDLFLGLGWLLREDKIETSEVDGEACYKAAGFSGKMGNNSRKARPTDFQMY